ncbi:acylphosphatase [Pelobium manganitolerans]|uniref:acylphosphatase n=1 Tax=Pelobium manganitolerans TaxID=1842495 RepID=A0A419S1J0_9SPHI|nr:acylphosphatase [Pelobium manganitolerans]RKD12351.1 acylphosphatase [Pelobium manganitolerans]
MKAIQISVFGRVQRVFFRASTKSVADQLGIKGFVKNLNDGSVQIHAEGDPYLLDAFLDWCKEGPEHARVDEIKVEDTEVKNYRNFEVLKR